MQRNSSVVLLALLLALGLAPSASAQQAINVIQLGGVTIDLNSGVAGAGTLRTSEATDSTFVLGIGGTSDAAATAGSTGSINAKLRLLTSDIDAVKTSVQTLDNAISGAGFNISQIGGVAPTTSACDDPSKVSNANIDISTSGNNEIVALTSSQIIYVCGFDLIADGAAVDVQWIYGTGTACATGETDMRTYPFDSTNGFGLTVSNGGAVQFKTASSNALCIELSGANRVTGGVSYVKQ